MNLVRCSIACFALTGALAACASKDGAPAPTGSSAQALSSVNVFHSVQSGGGASGGVTRSDADSYYNVWFQAWENKTAGGSRTASLSFSGYGASLQEACYDEQICSAWDYNTWQCTAWETVQYCYTYQSKPYYVYGYGDVPTADFRVGAHTAHLQTDLANDPSFMAIRCAYDDYWTYTCTPMTGTIDVVWRDNGDFSTEQQGTWSMTAGSPWGQYTTRSVGHTSEASATATGTFLGDLVGADGKISQSKGVNVSKDVFQAPPPPPPGGDAGAPPPPPPPDGG